MGIIQNALNQTLGAAAIATRLDPKFETRIEKNKLKEQYKQLQVLQEATDHNPDTTGLLTEEQAAISKRLAQLDPTEENVRTYINEASTVEANKPEERAAEQELIRQRANAIASGRQEFKSDQKKNFVRFTTLITNPQVIEEEWRNRNNG